MDATCGIEPDFTLRTFLANPEMVDRPVSRSPGFAAMRFLIAVGDALQMIVMSVVTAWAFFPDRAIESAGMG